MSTRDSLRNVAIVAHVDHGKTTLVDAMLWQSGAFTSHQADTGEVDVRVMDSMDLEREKGITILAKNTAVEHRTPAGDPITINIIDTPGHADFGGEVERGLSMVDGVVLLVDASEGPLPQTRFVLRKALEQKLPVILVINKVDRPDARIAEVVDETYELFLDLDADEHQIEFPIVYASAKAGRASLKRPAGRRACPRRRTSSRCSRRSSPRSRRPSTPRARRCRPTSPTWTPRPTSAGSRCAGCTTARSARASRRPGAAPTARSSGSRSPSCCSPRRSSGCRPSRAGPGDIIAIAGIPEITIGETLADPENPVPLPVITIDEPSISMTIGINTAPLAGESGKKLTARLVKSALGQPSWSATSRSGSSTPSARTPGRSRAAASCSWPSWSRSCAARASSSRSASRRSSPGWSTARCTSRWSA